MSKGLRSVTVEQAQSAKWVEWQNTQGVLRAHAIDPTSEARTGKLRTFTGSLIPASAVDAAPSTPRDAFCEKLIADILAGRIGKKQPSPEALARKEAKAALKAQRAEAKALANQTRKEQLQARKEAKAAEKAAKKAERLEAKAKTEAEKQQAAKAATEGKSTNLLQPAPQVDKLDEQSTPGFSLDYSLDEKKVWIVCSTGKVGGFDKSKVKPAPVTAPVVKVSDKTWAVYQGKQRIAFGVIKNAA